MKMIRFSKASNQFERQFISFVQDRIDEQQQNEQRATV